MITLFSIRERGMDFNLFRWIWTGLIFLSQWSHTYQQGGFLSNLKSSSLSIISRSNAKDRPRPAPRQRVLWQATGDCLSAHFLEARLSKQLKVPSKEKVWDTHMLQWQIEWQVLIRQNTKWNSNKIEPSYQH